MRYWTRSQWKARPPTAMTVMPKPVDTLYVHHDAGQLMSDPPPTIRQIQRTHQDVQEWRDIAYQEWIAYNGDVFEGRGFGVTDGATAGQSGHSLSICLQGNFESVIPPARQIDSLVTRIVAAAQEGRLSPGFRILAHQQAPAYYRNGTNLNATACCGKWLLERLPEIRERVNAALHPIPIPDPTDPEDDMTPFYIRYDLHPKNSSQVGVWLVDWTGRKSPVQSTDVLDALNAEELIVKTVDLSKSPNGSEIFLTAMHK